MKLTTPSLNKKETAAFLETKPQAYELPNFVVPAGYELLANSPTQTEEGTLQTICLIYAYGPEPTTVYKLKMIVRNEPNAYLPMKNCTQLLVWRQISGEHRAILSGFARTFFNYLLRSHSIMISDEQQTDDGKRFWLDRMGESFAIAKQDVCYIDLDSLDDSMTPLIEKIENVDDLMEVYVPKGWGTGEEYKNKAFVISNRDLS